MGVRVGRDGFTLIELMIAVAIIGTLASIAIPNFKQFKRDAKHAEVHAMINGLTTAAKAYYAQTRGDINADGAEQSHCRAVCRGGGAGFAKVSIDLSDTYGCRDVGFVFDAPVYSYYYMGPSIFGDNGACGIVEEGALIQQLGSLYDFDGDGLVGMDSRRIVVRDGKPYVSRSYSTNQQETIDWAAAVAAAFAALNF